jgi:hypothetical protein
MRRAGGLEVGGRRRLEQVVDVVVRQHRRHLPDQVLVDLQSML